MKNRSLLCVILAAGKGTRMKSDIPKVLHPVAGLPMVAHVLRAAQGLNADKIVVVIGPDQDAVAAAVAPHDTVVQTDRLGTGHAVKTALARRDLTDTDVMVLYGDVPLVPADALAACVDKHRRLDAGVTILAMQPDAPTGYGRLVTDAQGFVTRVVEELDATPAERAINLCSSGMMVLRGERLNDHLAAIKNDNAKGEYYLLDVLPRVRDAGFVCTYVVGDAHDLDGVNDRVQLARAEQRMQNRLRDAHMKNGVTMIDPSTVYCAMDTVIAHDVTIEPNVYFGPGVKIDTGVRILANCYLEDVRVNKGAQIGPFARMRGNTSIGEKTQIGNFVEVNNSVIAERSKAMHLNYIGYADIGADVNFGAGALISNYDGAKKHRSAFKDRSFIGVNSTLISPITVGEDSYIAAGSTITDDLPDGQLAFGRARQVNRDHTEKTKQFSIRQIEKAKK